MKLLNKAMIGFYVHQYQDLNFKINKMKIIIIIKYKKHKDVFILDILYMIN